MKRAVFFFLYVAILFICFDVSLGFFDYRYLKKHDFPGDYKALDYLINKCDAECLILGSSLARNSLMPSLMEDSLGMSCYNGGANAQIMPFFETVLNCALSRYTPKMVIFVLNPNELSHQGLGKRFNVLIPYYGAGHDFLDRYLESKDALEPWLLKSATYRYNKIWWRILLYHFIDYSDNSDKGFVPHEVPLKLPEPYSLNTNPTTGESVDCFNRCLDMCAARNIKVVCVFPPVYYNLIEGTYPSISTAMGICKKRGVICFDNSQDSTFHNHPEWFYDNAHLNKHGSVRYTNQFMDELKFSLDSIDMTR